MPNFADLEQRVNKRVFSKLHNLVVLDASSVVMHVVLDKGDSQMGHYDSIGETRLRITVNTFERKGLKAGDVLTADPATYDADELAAMDQTSFVLDAKEDEDLGKEVWLVR